MIGRFSVEQAKAEVTRSEQISRHLLHNYFTVRRNPILQGSQSGQMDLTVNQAGYALRRFESYPLQAFSDDSDDMIEPAARTRSALCIQANDTPKALAIRSSSCSGYSRAQASRKRYGFL